MLLFSHSVCYVCTLYAKYKASKEFHHFIHLVWATCILVGRNDSSAELKTFQFNGRTHQAKYPTKGNTRSTNTQSVCAHRPRVHTRTVYLVFTASFVFFGFVRWFVEAQNQIEYPRILFRTLLVRHTEW